VQVFGIDLGFGMSPELVGWGFAHAVLQARAPLLFL
jgi:hypothetical protein